VEGEDFAVGELDQRPSIVCVLGLLEIGVHGGLTQGEDLVHLLLGVGQTLRDVEVVACDVDLKGNRVRAVSVIVGSLPLTSWTPMSTKMPPDWAENVTKKPVR
jgi:hypothetical protein